MSKNILLSVLVLVSQSNIASIAAVRASAGGLIAFTLTDASGRLQIFTMRPDGTGEKQLTFEGDNGRPAWSRDGKRIVFIAHRGRSRNPEAGDHMYVAVMNADGSQQRLLTEGNAPDWSPDGKRIAFCGPAAGLPGAQIFVMDADGGNRRQITHSPTWKCGPSWSPDGRRMAFILMQNPASPSDPQPRIGIMNADGSGERVLTVERRVNVRVQPDGTETVLETADDANAPAWSPAGDRIAFWSGIENQYGQIWVINADGTGSRQLTDDPSHRNNDDPSWSPDGKQILFGTARGGRVEIWVMDSDGKHQRRLHPMDPFPFPGRASWQPVVNVR